ncbi:MAG: glycosyltransferase [Victivallales bacterium]|nr:glycosyltransferase [Victivallales bacterium]
MKTAIVIFTINACKRGLWNEVLDAVARQTFQPDERLVVDSNSQDKTVPIAIEHGWKTTIIRREDFNHGLTRTQILRNLQADGFDSVVFLSQDAILTSPDSLGTIMGFLHDNPVAGCFGRQIDTRRHSLGAWQKKCYYPEVSRIKTLADIPHLKLMTPFFSNAFAAWKIAEALEHGGFPCTMFGEDMLLAAKIIETGGAIGYCADAMVIHEHQESVYSLFQRGRTVGDFHRLHPELLHRFGPPLRPPLDANLPFIALRLLAKTLGYAWGRFRVQLTPWLIFALLWLFLLPAITLFDFMDPDVTNRYAPMAESFAAGDWQHAFHPRIPPMLPVCAGIIAWLFSCGGYLACRLTGALFLTCGIFPLYWGTKHVYGFRVATVATLMYAGCTRLFRLGYYGMRESICVFGVLLLYQAAVRLRMRSAGWWWYLVFAAGEATLLLTRGDMASFALATMAMLLFWDILRHHHPLRTLGVTLALLVMMLPALGYNYRMIGYPVTDVRQATILRRICRQFPVLKMLENPHPQVSLDIDVPTAEANDE